MPNKEDFYLLLLLKYPAEAGYFFLSK